MSSPQTVLTTFWGQVSLTLTEAAPVDARYLSREGTSRVKALPTVLIASRDSLSDDSVGAEDSDVILQLRPVARPYRWQTVLVGSATGCRPGGPFFQLPGSIIMGGRRGAASYNKSAAQQSSELCEGIEECFGASELHNDPDEGGNTGCAIRWASQRATESGDAEEGARVLAEAAAKLLQDADVLSSKRFTEGSALPAKPCESSKAIDKSFSANSAHTVPISRAHDRSVHASFDGQQAARDSVRASLTAIGLSV